MKNLGVLLAVLIFWLIASIGLQAHVTLLHPLGGESFEVGDTLVINWQLDQEHEQLSWELYFSDDAGETWNELASLAIEQFEYPWIIPEMDTELGRIRVVQDNELDDYEDFSENFRITIPDVVTATEGFGLTAESPGIQSNYPNPFRYITTIDFSILTTSSVSLDIYTLQGSKVATLVNGTLAPGHYSSTWQNPSGVPGVYLCRFQAGSIAQVRKLVKIE